MGFHYGERRKKKRKVFLCDAYFSNPARYRDWVEKTELTFIKKQWKSGLYPYPRYEVRVFAEFHGVIYRT